MLKIRSFSMHIHGALAIAVTVSIITRFTFVENRPRPAQAKKCPKERKILAFLDRGAQRKAGGRTVVALFRFFTIDRPRDAEAIGEHTKAETPERLLKRHTNSPSVRQFGKQTFCIAFTGLEHDAEAPRGFI